MLFADMLDNIYGVLGTAAVISGYSTPITVVDKTAGVELTLEKLSVPTIAPAAAARVAELTAIGVPNVQDLIKRVITFNRASWSIVNIQPKPTPEGEDVGEVYLILRKAAS